jgi:predicted phosphodiesterase
LIRFATDEEFIAFWNETGGKLQQIADKFGYASIRAVCNKRMQIEKRHNITLRSAAANSSRSAAIKRKNSRRLELTLRDGVIVIGSDAHVWPGPLTTAQRGFIKVIERLKPEVVVLNGDVFDGAKISRFPSAIWDMEARPSVKQELEACQGFVAAVEAASSARRIWTWGNHDARLESRLASLVPEYNGVPGFALRDHFPGWDFCMALFVNDNLVIKHRLKGGQHATHNNAMVAGRSIVTGHLHNPKYSPVTDYNGTRYGVDGGTLADPESKQFDYTEEAPLNWRASNVVITVRDGRLMLPEFVQVWDEDHVEFRGEVIPV